jgi:hypothetical protein
MIFDTIKCTIATHFLSPLVNGDYTGLDESELPQFIEWLHEATAPYHDADDNLWVFAHESVPEPDVTDFAKCEVTGMYSETTEVHLLFRPFNA